MIPRPPRILLVLALSVAFALSGVASALAQSGEQKPPPSTGNRESTGISDSLDNVSPKGLDNSTGAYWGKYPISRYGLDYNVTGVSADVGSEINPFDSGEGVDFSGIPAVLASMIVKVIWYACMYSAYAALALFQFAFNFNLLTGEDSALDPIAGAIKAFDDAIGLEFLAITITLFGLWAMWRALVQRRYGEAVGGFAASAAIMIAALAFTFYASDVVGFASDTLDATAQKFLAIAGALAPENTGEEPAIDSGEQSAINANQVDGGTLTATDALFKLLVYDSYTVLNFGGLQHCGRTTTTKDGDNDTDNKIEDDEAPVSLPVTKCPDQNGTMGSGTGGFDLVSNSYYANNYLSYNQGDDRRCCKDDGSEYSAIEAGDDGERKKISGEENLDPAPPGYPRALGPEDVPAVDMQQAPSQFQRLGMAALTAFFVFGGVFLITGFSIAVIVAQLLFLLVLAFAPIIAVLSFIPKYGPEIGLGWLKRLGILAGAKLYYSVLLALTIALAFALLSASDNYGWLMATGLTGLLLWILFFYRNKIQELITAGGAKAGGGFGKALAAGAALYTGRAALRAGGAVAKAGYRGTRAVGRQGIKTAAMPAASARAALDAPGRFSGLYNAGRERGMGVRRSAATAAKGAVDRQGARARQLRSAGARGESATQRKARMEKAEGFQRQSESQDRETLNRHLDRPQQYRSADGSPIGHGKREAASEREAALEKTQSKQRQAHQDQRQVRQDAERADDRRERKSDRAETITRRGADDERRAGLDKQRETDRRERETERRREETRRRVDQNRPRQDRSPGSPPSTPNRPSGSRSPSNRPPPANRPPGGRP